MRNLHGESVGEGERERSPIWNFDGMQSYLLSRLHQRGEQFIHSRNGRALTRHWRTEKEVHHLLPPPSPQPPSQWRARKEYNRKVVRSCPECRTHSDFIVPSNYWYEDDKEKEKFISGETVYASSPDNGCGKSPA